MWEYYFSAVSCIKRRYMSNYRSNTKDSTFHFCQSGSYVLHSYKNVDSGHALDKRLAAVLGMYAKFPDTNERSCSENQGKEL
jgi:hypothetical protein